VVRAYADLLKVRGVVIAGDFTPEGKLSGYKGKIDLSPEMAATAAKFAATIAMMLEALALAYSEIEKMGTGTVWVPERLWMYSGGDWTAAVSSPHWAIVNTAQLEFTPLYDPKKEVSAIEGAERMSRERPGEREREQSGAGPRPPQSR